MRRTKSDLREAYELPGAMVADRERRGGYYFRCRSHVIQRLLAYTGSGEKVPATCAAAVQAESEHRIEFESPALTRGESNIVQIRDAAFRFSCETKKLFGRWATHFTLRAVEDEVSPSNFGRHTGRKSWSWIPSTFFTIFVPEGFGGPARTPETQEFAF